MAEKKKRKGIIWYRGGLQFGCQVRGRSCPSWEANHVPTSWNELIWEIVWVDARSVQPLQPSPPLDEEGMVGSHTVWSVIWQSMNGTRQTAPTVLGRCQNLDWLPSIASISFTLSHHACPSPWAVAVAAVKKMRPASTPSNFGAKHTIPLLMPLATCLYVVSGRSSTRIACNIAGEHHDEIPMMSKSRSNDVDAMMQPPSAIDLNDTESQRSRLSLCFAASQHLLGRLRLPMTDSPALVCP